MAQTDGSLRTWFQTHLLKYLLEFPAMMVHPKVSTRSSLPSWFLRNVPMQMAWMTLLFLLRHLSSLLAWVFVRGLACPCACLDVCECICACVYPCAEIWSWHWVSLSVASCFPHWRSLAEPGPHQIWLFLESQLARKSPGSATWAWWLQMSANLPGFHVGTGDPKFCLYSFKSSPLSLKSPLPAPCLSQSPTPRNFY